ncbi:MAG: Nramp family divalent metal transporter, partial [Planctomycetia bacterium]|nr:Nramp family divalent metal transporter [Planctomycetia bacterium]
MEIGSGFFKFGNVPVLAGEDRNGNGVLDPGEDWDRDGKLDVQVEPKLPPIDSVIQSGEWPDLDGDGRPDAPIDTDGDGRFDVWPAIHGAKQQEIVDKKENGGRGDGQPDAWPDVIRDENGKTDGKPDTFADLNGDGYRDGPQTDNLIVAAAAGRKLAGPIDLSLIGMIAALAAIAGCGGLSNTPISNYTRDQGWGMGRHVGAIPSIVGGHKLALSHVGCVFKINKESLERWRGWYRHIVRDQCAVWGPACFIGIGLPCMLSIEFLRRGFVADQWATAAFTAGKVQERVA